MKKELVEIPVDNLYIPGRIIEGLANDKENVCHFILDNGAGGVIMRDDQVVDMIIRRKSLEKQLARAKGLNYAILFAAFCTLSVILAKRLKKKIEEDNKEFDIWLKNKLGVVSPSQPNQDKNEEEEGKNI